MRGSRARPVSSGSFGKARIVSSSQAARRACRRREARRLGRRMKQLLGRVLRRLQLLPAGELRRVLAVQAHDLPRRVEPPQVRGRVVAERGQPALHVRVVVRGRVEVDTGVGRRLLAVGPQHALEVADPHVVGDEGEILALELLARDRQIAGAAGERLDRVEALVDHAPVRAQPLGLGEPAGAQRASDAASEAPAAVHLDPHARAGSAPSRRGSASARRRPRGRRPVRPAARRSRGTRAPPAARAGRRRRRPPCRPAAATRRRARPSPPRRPASARRADGWCPRRRAGRARARRRGS